MASVWDGLSFDPRTWGDAPALPLAIAGLDRRRLLLACLGSAGLLAVGGGLARWSRGRGGGATTAVVAGEAGQPATIRRAFRIDGASGLRGALVASGVQKIEAAEVVAAARSALVATGEISAALTFDAAVKPLRLIRAELSNPDTSGVVVASEGGRFVGRAVAANLTSRVFVKRGQMDEDSFYSSAVAAGVTDSLIPVFAKALAFDFDFQRDVHRGDAFEAAFEQDVDSNGAAVGPPHLLFASITTALKSAAVYAFTPPGGEPGWFDASGRSVVRALMRTPVDGARVSSTFGMRVHPVLGFQKMHKGIDFAAAVGTPIFAAGDGKVELASPSETAGNWLRLLHDNGWETVYMHMNRYMPGIVAGARVAQGQQVGEVGTTGRSTGPHLHYEVHINGEPVDPTSIDTGSGVTLSGPALESFGRERDRIDVSRARESA